jgi:hypothetical protein
MRRPVAALCVLLSIIASGNSGNTKADTTEGFVQLLLDQGVSQTQILGIDQDGIPLVCGTAVEGTLPTNASPPRGGGLPGGTRGWESIPGVIRDDGLETFRVEVDVNGDVAGVTMSGITVYLVPPQAPPVELRDDGLGEDRVAGDFVFTSGLFQYDTSVAMPAFFQNDSTSPPGLFNVNVGTVTVEELDGATTQFLIKPAIGLLRSDIVETTSVALSTDIAFSPHLINIRTSARETQRFLRFLGGDLTNLTNPVYQVLPDVIDFFVFFSTNKIELVPRTSSPNFNARVHLQVQTNFTGTGLSPFDATASYGSDGVLLSVNVLDAYDRGIRSGNATHEIIHQWASYTSTSLGLSDGTGHYKSRSSAASLVGGFRWIDNGNGTFTRDCTEGRNGAHHAPLLDKYMMGLIDGNAVAPLYVSGLVGSLDCGEVIDDPFITVTIGGIQNTHGVRTPGPAEAQHNFVIAFVAESYDRLLNSTEMTFYEILAEHYASPVPAGDPDPYVGFNWASIDRFFGENTTWPTLIRRFYDFDGDGDVDFDDLGVFVAVLLGEDPDPNHHAIADMNTDGSADGLDIQPFVDELLSGGAR